MFTSPGDRSGRRRVAVSIVSTAPNGLIVGGVGVIPRNSFRVPNWCVIDASGGFNDTGGGPNHTVNGTNAAQVDATGAFRRFTLGATTPNGVSSNGGSGWSWGDYNPFAEAIIRTGSSITGAAGDAANYVLLPFDDDDDTDIGLQILLFGAGLMTPVTYWTVWIVASQIWLVELYFVVRLAMK